MKKILSLLLFTIVSAQPLPSDKLQPVQSLFIKPSADGSTGDLYVAATEENGISNWLTDQPVNFLPSLGLQSASILPKLLSASLTAKAQDEESQENPQKRAILAQGEELKNELPKPEVEDIIPSSETPEETTEQEVTTEQPKLQFLPQYLPYQYLYPNLAAAVNAVNSDKKEAAVIQNTQNAQYWPSGYRYSTYPYMMVDPRFWAWAQAAGSANQQNTAQASYAQVEANEV